MSPQTQIEIAVQSFKSILDDRLKKYTDDITLKYQGLYNAQVGSLSTEMQKMFSELSQKIDAQSGRFDELLKAERSYSEGVVRRVGALEKVVDALDQRSQLIKEGFSSRDLRMTAFASSQASIVSVVKDLVARSGNPALVRRVAVLEDQVKQAVLFSKKDGLKVAGVEVPVEMAIRAAHYLPWFVAGIAIAVVAIATAALWFFLSGKGGL